MAAHGNGDELVQALLAGGRVRALAAVTTRTAEEARWRHDLYPTAAAALGRTLTVSAFLGAMLKDSQRVFVEIAGDGPLGFVRADADPQGRVRGYVGNPHVHLPANAKGKLDVAGAIGRGMLHIVRDLGVGQPYRGYVPLVSGEIGEDFAHYFMYSEQTPSVVAVGVLVDTDGRVRASGGLLVQLLPGAGETLIPMLEERARALPPVSRAIDAGQGPDDLIGAVAQDLDVKILRRLPVRFSCRCSRQRFERALVALGEEELRDMLDSDGSAELVCHFCAQHYRFSARDLETLLAEATKREQ
ncbi:MAG: Hsp33 family molecular chaperone HslO [Firmicutes bacterium]|nr:Hsp33 family molecular chaperone HslO [Bacillota bacterium]